MQAVFDKFKSMLCKCMRYFVLKHCTKLEGSKTKF